MEYFIITKPVLRGNVCKTLTVDDLIGNDQVFLLYFEFKTSV